MKRSMISWLCMLVAAGSVQAVDRVWTGAAGGGWGAAGNWDTGVPAAGDRAYFTHATPGATNVVLDADYTLSHTVATQLLYFNSAHNYTIGGSGTLTFSSADATTRNMLSIAGAGTIQTFDADLVFDAAGTQRIATTADAGYVFNGSICFKKTAMVRLNDLNSTAVFNGQLALTNGALLNIYGGTVEFNAGVSGHAGGSIVTLRGQGRDTLAVLGNAAGPVFESSLVRVQLGVAPGYQTTVRLAADNQIAANVWFRVAVLEMNGHDNTSAGWLRLATTNETSTVRFGQGESLWFADSSGQAWADGAILDLQGFDFETCQLRFGRSAGGLTAQQLGQIRLDGAVVAGLALDSEGFLMVKGGIPDLSSVSAAEELKAHILNVRGSPLTDLEVKTVLRVSDYGAVPDDGVNDLPGITAAVNAAAAAAKPVLVLFEKGRYHAYSASTSAQVIDVRNTQDTIVDGQGAEVVVQSPYLNFSFVRSSSNIIIRNFDVEYDPLPFSQGTVVAVDAANGAFEVETEAGFPDPDAAFFAAAESWGMLKDPAHPGRLKPGSVSFYRRTSCVPLGGNRFRIVLEIPSNIAHFQIGDRYAQVGRLGRLGGFLGGDQVTFMNLTAYSCPGGLFVGSRTSRLNVLNCRSILKEGRLLVTGADGVHVQSARIGPWVEGCRFEGLSDDGCNFYSVPNHVLGVTDARTLVMERIAFLLPGDRLAFFQPQSGRILAVNKITAISGSSVTFEEDLPALSIAPPGTPYDSQEWKIYDHAYNLDATGNYFVFRNNTVCNGRRYGSYFKASQGLVAGNRFEGLSHAGIVLWNEPNWPEGFYSRDIVIAENTILDCASQDTAAIKISFKNLGAYSAEAEKQANFYLYRNRVESAAKPALEISRTDGIAFAANRIAAGPSVGRAVILKDSRIRPDESAGAVADAFDRPDGVALLASEVPALLGADWRGGAGTRWELLDQELSMVGPAQVYHLAGPTPNSGTGDWFIASATLRLDTTADSAWAGVVFNHGAASGKFLAFRFNGLGQVQLVRPDGTAQLSVAGFSPVQNRPYRLTAASFQPHAYYLEVKDMVTDEVLYSDTTANTQAASNGLSDGYAGLFSSTALAAFQEFRVWNSTAEPSFTQLRGVPLAWYAAQGISPQGEGVGTWEELDELDSTGQGRPNWQVYAGGTDPSDPAAGFGIAGLHPDGAGRLRLEWLGGTYGASGPYVIQYKDDLISAASWSYLGMQERINGTNQWIGSVPPPGVQGFFRIGAEPNRF